ncbi:MAG TPA: YdcH family protein [Thiohalobacter sp.]|nr:YdcH family protein [Thiohalobacter sp.]
MDPTEQHNLRQRLEALRLEHRDLDEALLRLNQDPAMNQLTLQRMKKRKLMLKDMIHRLESALIPDLDA